MLLLPVDRVLFQSLGLGLCELGVLFDVTSRRLYACLDFDPGFVFCHQGLLVRLSVPSRPTGAVRSARATLLAAVSGNDLEGLFSTLLQLHARGRGRLVHVSCQGSFRHLPIVWCLYVYLLFIYTNSLLVLLFIFQVFA
jgi:hypothetical protein